MEEFFSFLQEFQKISKNFNSQNQHKQQPNRKMLFPFKTNRDVLIVAFCLDPTENFFQMLKSLPDPLMREQILKTLQKVQEDKTAEETQYPPICQFLMEPMTEPVQIGEHVENEENEESVEDEESDVSCKKRKISDVYYEKSSWDKYTEGKTKVVFPETGKMHKSKKLCIFHCLPEMNIWQRFPTAPPVVSYTKGSILLWPFHTKIEKSIVNVQNFLCYYFLSVYARSNQAKLEMFIALITSNKIQELPVSFFFRDAEESEKTTWNAETGERGGSVVGQVGQVGSAHNINLEILMYLKNSNMNFTLEAEHKKNPMFHALIDKNWKFFCLYHFLDNLIRVSEDCAPRSANVAYKFKIILFDFFKNFSGSETTTSTKKGSALNTLIEILLQNDFVYDKSTNKTKIQPGSKETQETQGIQGIQSTQSTTSNTVNRLYLFKIIMCLKSLFYCLLKHNMWKEARDYVFYQTDIRKKFDTTDTPHTPHTESPTGTMEVNQLTDVYLFFQVLEKIEKLEKMGTPDMMQLTEILMDLKTLLSLNDHFINDDFFNKVAKSFGNIDKKDLVCKIPEIHKFISEIIVNKVVELFRKFQIPEAHNNDEVLELKNKFTVAPNVVYFSHIYKGVKPMCIYFAQETKVPVFFSRFMSNFSGSEEQAIVINDNIVVKDGNILMQSDMHGLCSVCQTIKIVYFQTKDTFTVQLFSTNTTTLGINVAFCLSLTLWNKVRQTIFSNVKPTLKHCLDEIKDSEEFSKFDIQYLGWHLTNILSFYKIDDKVPCNFIVKQQEVNRLFSDCYLLYKEDSQGPEILVSAKGLSCLVNFCQNINATKFIEYLTDETPAVAPDTTELKQKEKASLCYLFTQLIDLIFGYAHCKKTPSDHIKLELTKVLSLPFYEFDLVSLNSQIESRLEKHKMFIPSFSIYK